MASNKPIVAKIFTVYDSKGTKAARKDIKAVTDQIGKIGKKAAIGFGLAAGAVAAFGVASVKAAVEDQKSQALLANTLRNTTKATDDQIASVEKYITNVEMASGVLDDKLRPSLQTLLNATNDVTKAQTLQGLALDVSAGTGKDLESVSIALAKAYSGNLTALVKLGIPLDKNAVKTKNLNKVLVTLGNTFKGSAKTAANTYEGRLSRLQIAFQNVKETIGYALFPLLEKLSNWIFKTAIPAFQTFINQNGKQLVAAFKVAVSYGTAFFKLIIDVVKFMATNSKIIIGFGTVIVGVFVAMKAAAASQAIINSIKAIIMVMKALRTASLAAAVAEAFATAGTSVAAGAIGVAAFGAAILVANKSMDSLNNEFDKQLSNTSDLNLELGLGTSKIPDYTAGLSSFADGVDSTNTKLKNTKTSTKELNDAMGEMANKLREPQVMLGSIQSALAAIGLEYDTLYKKVTGKTETVNVPPPGGNVPAPTIIPHGAAESGMPLIPSASYGSTAAAAANAPSYRTGGSESAVANVTVNVQGSVVSQDELVAAVMEGANAKLRAGAKFFASMAAG